MLVGHLFGTLDVNGCVVLVQTEAHAVLYGMETGVGRVVAMGQGVDIAEGQHRLELDGGRLVVVEDGVFDDDPVGIVEQEELLGEVELAHAILVQGDVVGGEVLEILVALRVDGPALVLVDADVEIHIVDHDGLVQVGDQHVALVVHLVLRHNEETVVFAGVQPREGGGGEGAGTAATQNLPRFREIKVY